MGKGRDYTAAAGCAGCVCFCIVFTVPFLIGYSFRVVGYDQYGLKVNSVTHAVYDEPAYDTGRYFVGLGKNFLRFNKTFQVVEFHASAEDEQRKPLEVRANLQKIQIELSFEYQIRKDFLRELYRDFKFEYEPIFVTKARGSLQITASQYEVADFYGPRRSVVEEAMRQTLEDELDQRYTDLKSFQLRQVFLPEDMDRLILDVPLKEQETRLSFAKLEEEGIRLNTTAMIEVLAAEKENLLLRLQTETETMRVLILRNVSQIKAETERLVEEIVVQSETAVSVYNQETENQRRQLAANVTTIEENTAQQARQIQLETEALRADTEAQKTAIRSQAEAYRVRVVEEAIVEAEGLMQNARARAFRDLAAAVGLSGPEIMQLEWMATLEPHDADRLMMDLYTPTALLLPGQRDSYLATTGS